MITKKVSINRKKRGFTLIELIIYMGILSTIMIVLTDIFVAVLQSRTESEATSAVEQDSRFIISRLSYDIARSSSITNPAGLGTSSNSLTLVIGSENFNYSLSGTDFQLTNNTGTNDLNGAETKVDSINFTKIGNPSGKETIQLQLIISSSAVKTGGAETRTYQTTIGRR